MDNEYIQTQLTKFNVTATAVAELNAKYNDLTIINTADEAGYKAVRAARLEIKGYRVGVEKMRKSLNEGALAYTKAINSEAKRVTALLEPLEDKLSIQEKQFDEAKEKLRLEVEAAHIETLRVRASKVISLGATFDGVEYKIFTSDCGISNKTSIFLSIDQLKYMDDESYNQMIIELNIHYIAVCKSKLEEELRQKELKEKEEAARLEEQTRLTQQRREQEMESERLADIAKSQSEEAARLIVEQERLDKIKKESDAFSAKMMVNELDKQTIINNVINDSQKEMTSLIESVVGKGDPDIIESTISNVTRETQSNSPCYGSNGNTRSIPVKSGVAVAMGGDAGGVCLFSAFDEEIKPLQETITITILKSRYDELIDDQLFLHCLQRAGVDNWEGYDEAADKYGELKKDQNV